jgi:hypothetical protein
MDRRVRQEVKAMTRNEVIVRAIAKEITWIQAAWICGITDRHMRRLKEGYLERGFDGLVDHRGGRSRRKRIALETIEQVSTLCCGAVSGTWKFLAQVSTFQTRYPVPDQVVGIEVLYLSKRPQPVNLLDFQFQTSPKKAVSAALVPVPLRVALCGPLRPPGYGKVGNGALGLRHTVRPGRCPGLKSCRPCRG